MNVSEVTRAPELLLQTWAWMVTESQDPQIIAHAAKCLQRELGSEESVEKYLDTLES